MDVNLKNFIEHTFELAPAVGESKLNSLNRAIKNYVKPGLKLFLGWNSNAIVCELIRQYDGKKPEFSAVMTATWDHSLNLIHRGLLKKLTTSSCSFLFPNPAPSPMIQKAYHEGAIELENWSLYSIQQRLMAGALGVGFMPTKSVFQSSMADENRHFYKEIEAPFDRGKKIAVVKAINPDLSLVHGLAADIYGNTILSPVGQDTAWGAMASLGGIVVTVEKIVSIDFIRRHSALVDIPGHLVISVSECPFGAHPEGLFSHLEDIQGYREDYDFMLSQKKASTRTQLLDSWIKDWVIDVKDHKDFLRKLGLERMVSLQEKANDNSWKQELNSVLDLVSLEDEYNSKEMMIIAAARAIIGIIRRSGYQLLLAGIGACGLAAWLAFYQLRKKGYQLDLALGSGVLGYVPRPPDPMVINTSNAFSATMLTDTSLMYGFIVGGGTSKCLSSLGAAQIDKYGNINTTKLESDLFIIGSGGNNDGASGAKEVIVVVPQSKRRCVDKVDYITCPGGKVRTLVTTMGIFEKGDNGKFVLTGYFREARFPSSEKMIRRISEHCGWKLDFSRKIKQVPAPTDDELLTLRLLDANQYYTKP